MITHPEAQSSSIKRFITDYPLASYFIIAYVGTWIVLLPAVLAQNGLGLLPFTLPDVLAFLSFVLFSSFAGPTLAAYIVTRVTSGREGVREFLRRYVQWRVGIRWYLAALFIFLVGFLISVSLSLGATPVMIFIQKSPLIFSSFLPNVLIFVLLGFFGEEPGWRGFAIPRLQQEYGPVKGSLILGALHGFWHLPAFLVADALGPFTFPLFLTFIITGIAGTILYTWIYNNTGGSILIAILTHAASNAASGFIVQNIVPENPQLDGFAQVVYTQNWGNVIAFGALALLVILFTRGQLSYRPAEGVKNDWKYLGTIRYHVDLEINTDRGLFMGVMMQTFFWDCPRVDNREFQWWNYVREQVSALAKAGFTSLWLPPVYEAAKRC